MSDIQQQSYEDRVTELRSLPWAEVKDAAEAVGHVKPDDEKWSEQAEAIARLEFLIQGDEAFFPEFVEQLAIEAVEPEFFATDYYRAIGVTIGSDGDKIKTDLNGNVIN